MRHPPLFSPALDQLLLFFASELRWLLSCHLGSSEKKYEVMWYVGVWLPIYYVRASSPQMPSRLMSNPTNPSPFFFPAFILSGVLWNGRADMSLLLPQPSNLVAEESASHCTIEMVLPSKLRRDIFSLRPYVFFAAPLRIL